MIHRDPKCVYVTDVPGDADVVAVWLGHEDVPAQVMNRATLGGLLGLTPWSMTGVSSGGIEVWVLDEKHVERARGLIASYEEEKQQQVETKASLGPIEATCDECDHTSTFQADQRGSVQDCPRCG